jgi:hypothetical protein
MLLIISHNQSDIDKISITKADKKKYSALIKACIVNTPLVVKVNNAIEVYIGHGDDDTR